MPACRIRYHTAPATDCWLTGSASMGAAQVRDDHLAGKDRHNYGHEMMPDGLPASLPGRLTESTVYRRAGSGWDWTRLAELVVSP